MNLAEHDPSRPSRRSFLAAASAAAATALAAGAVAHAADAPASAPWPLIDYHAHPDDHALDDLVGFARARGVKLGIVEHAGTKENKYPVVLSTDEDLRAWRRKLEPKGVLVGVQAEFYDWPSVFSKAAVAELDYVLGDAMTMRDKAGKRMHIWKPEELRYDDEQAFMDAYVDCHLEIMATPIDILGNTTYLPPALAGRYDALWTERRMMRVIDAAKKHGVAIEISSAYDVPGDAFLKLAKAAGCRFSFGSNGRGRAVGKIDFSIAAARRLGLRAEDLFAPRPAGKKRIEVG